MLKLFALAVAGTVLVFLIGSIAFSWAWNHVMASTFGAPALDIGAAFALLIGLTVLRVFFLPIYRSGK